MRAPASKPRWLNPAPCTAAKGMYLVGRASKNCLAQRSSGRCGCDLEAGTAVNMRGRLYGLVACLTYQAPNVAAGLHRPRTDR